MQQHSMQSIQSGETAADLRRQLHQMKTRDRQRAVVAAQTTASQKFLKSSYFSGLAAAVAVFLILYVANPIFVQSAEQSTDATTGRPTGPSVVVPNLKRVGAWAVLAGLLVVFGPIVWQKVSTRQ